MKKRRENEPVFWKWLSLSSPHLVFSKASYTSLTSVGAKGRKAIRLSIFVIRKLTWLPCKPNISVHFLSMRPSGYPGHHSTLANNPRDSIGKVCRLTWWQLVCVLKYSLTDMWFKNFRDCRGSLSVWFRCKSTWKRTQYILVYCSCHKCYVILMLLKHWCIIFIFTFEIENAIVSNANNNVSINVLLLVNVEIER